MEVVERPIDSVFPYARNNKIHLKSQVSRIAKSIKSFGFNQPIVVDETDTIVVGHGRHLAAKELKLKTIPVVKIVGLSEEQKRAYRLLDNKLADDAEWNLDNVGMELNFLKEASFDLSSWGLDSGAFASVLESVDEANEAAAAGVGAGFDGVMQYDEGVLFPSSNKWGIPDLLPNRLSSLIPRDTYGGQDVYEKTETLFLYGSYKMTAEKAEGGVLGFYVDDYRFEKVWDNAVAFIKEMKEVGWGALITPDFSTWADWPFAVQMYNIYRNRWCARYWQEAGFNIIPSLSSGTDDIAEVAISTMPRKPPVVSLQVRTTKTAVGKKRKLDDIGRVVEEVQPENVLIYGGEEHSNWLRGSLPAGPEYHLLRAFTSVRAQVRGISPSNKQTEE